MRNVRLPPANGTTSRWHRRHGKQCSVIYHASKARRGACLPSTPPGPPVPEFPRVGFPPPCWGRSTRPRLLAPAIAAEAGRHSARTPAALRLSRVRGLLTRFGRRDRWTRRVDGLVRHWPRDVVGSG